MKTCWICTTPADSAEHKFKKSDLVALYGKGPYKEDSELAHVQNSTQSKIQGPNSNAVKYDKNLCQKCNTTLTQPFDKAYEQFITWLIQNNDKVLRQRFIDFRDVYGDNFEIGQLNLFKYFVKSLGCRIADAGREVPQDLIQLLSRDRFRTKLRITFAVNEDLLLLLEEDQIGVGKGDLLGTNDNTGFYWKESFRWLSVYYWYGYLPDGDLGSTWIANAQHVYLGSYAPLTSEMRAELIEKVKNRIAS